MVGLLLECALEYLLLAWIEKCEAAAEGGPHFESLKAAASQFSASAFEKRGFAEIEKPDALWDHLGRIVFDVFVRHKWGFSEYWEWNSLFDLPK